MHSTATNYEPPFRLDPSTSGYDALVKLQNGNILINKHVLELLRAVYEEMGNRDGLSHRWLPKPASRANDSAITAYRNELQMFIERGKGHPRALLTVKQACKMDRQVNETGNLKLRQASNRNERGETLVKVKNRMFSEAKKILGALASYINAVEGDHERYAKELKRYKEVTQRTFDEENGVLPIQTSIED